MAHTEDTRALADGGSLTVVLSDGAEVEIRRLRPTDVPALRDAFERLSAESRRLRFISPKVRLSEAELRYLTDVDGHRHEALAASDARTGAGIGVARFIRLEDEPDVAEVAVTVVDEWQHRGLGTLLLEALAERARSEGITHFSALISSDNTVMLDMLRHSGGELQPTAAGGGVVEYRSSLREPGLASDLRQALRSAAEGTLRVPTRLREGLVGLARQAHLTRGAER